MVTPINLTNERELHLRRNGELYAVQDISTDAIGE